MSKKYKVSVIIPVRTITPYVKETVGFLKRQTEKEFEIIVVTDNKEGLNGVKVVPSGVPTPAYKRNLAVKRAEGAILAFLDDDSYPDCRWLENALKIFEESSGISAVCGPTLTPPTDNIYQKASGWVWATWLGSGGAGVYRNKIMPRREVDDFPSVNLMVRKKDFEEIGGFDIAHWPGEDTKLCLDLIKLGRKIVYDPSILVYHHRRAVFLPHLKQISRYAMRRGYFARVFPETSFRLGYLLPSVFAYGLVIGAIISLIFVPIRILYLLLITYYLLLLLFSGLEVLFKEKNPYLSFLVMLTIVLTHLVYGLLFPLGFIKKEIKTVPHKLDNQKKSYIGG